jgi:hypothetical protein
MSADQRTACFDRLHSTGDAPYGLLSDLHHGACWRVGHIHRMHQHIAPSVPAASTTEHRRASATYSIVVNVVSEDPPQAQAAPTPSAAQMTRPHLDERTARPSPHLDTSVDYGVACTASIAKEKWGRLKREKRVEKAISC